jgi:cytochrome c oxidase subunit III
MATTVHEPPKIDSRRLPDQGHTGQGGWTNPSRGDLRVALKHSPPPSSTAIWVVLFAVTMMFAAFTSALVVRKGSSLDWQTFNLPSILYFNTLLLLASSVTLEVARRRVSAFMGGLKSQSESPARWLYITLFLGLLFVAGQYVAWSQLRAEGLYLATNPSSAFFYVLTVTHALHVLGGLGGLIYVIRKLSDLALRRNQLDAAARYWHFMDFLWVYLILLLWIKL